MARHHPKNERIKRAYSLYLEEAQRMAPKSVDAALAAISQFEASTSHRDFARFHVEQARRFKRLLDEQVDPRTKRPLAKATLYARLKAVRRFFHWLAGQPGYKSRISYADADYFNPSANDGRIATARREGKVPSLEQIRHVLVTMAVTTPIEQRDRALIAFILLTGARDDAVASLSLRHVDLDRRLVDQDARTVRTKNRKSFPTWFFPVGADVERIVAEWVTALRSEFLFGPDDPLFPATKVALDADKRFAPAGLDRRHWSNADPIRRIFREAFARAGLPYFNPHSVRKTLARLGETVCTTPEAFKAWSQNLGHEDVLTTFTSYGAVSRHRQADIMAGLREASTRREQGDDPLDPETLQRAVRQLLASVS